MRFNFNYFTTFTLLLLTEILLTQTTGFLRHTFGDFLAVITVFYFMKTFYNIPSIKLGIGVLIFSFIVEFLQLTSFLSLLESRYNKTVNIIFGNTFSITDLIAYSVGSITAVFIDKKTKTRS